MKTKTTISLLCCMLSLQAWAQSHWTVEHPSEIRNGYFFIDNPNDSAPFYLFGYDQLVFDPNTKTLEKVNDLPSGILTKELVGTYSAPNRHMDIHFTSEHTGILAFHNRLLKTTNGGQQWKETLVLSPNTKYATSSYFTDVDFPSNKVGYAVGTADKIFKTTDAGDTWQEIQWSTSTTPYRRLSHVRFTDENHGYVLGYEVDDILLNIGVYSPLIYETTNGGTTWTERQLAETDHHYVDIHFTGTDTMYLSMINRNAIFPSDRILKSVDDGQSWSEVDLPGLYEGSSLVLRAIHWFSAEEGVLLGSQDFSGQKNDLFKTIDGGESWSKIDLPHGIAPVFSKIANLTMEFSGDHGLISGASGNIIHTEDRGDSWSVIRQGLPDIKAIHVSEDVTYAAGWGNLLLMKENDQWIEISTPPPPENFEQGFRKVANNGKDRIALVDAYRILHLTTDGGNGWSSHFLENDTTVFDVTYHNNKLKVLTRLLDGRLLLLVLDENTNSWSEQLIAPGQPSPNNAQVQIVDQSRIFIKTDLTIFYTKDDGNQWEAVTSLPDQAIPTTFFADPSGIALVQTLTNGLFYSTDTASTWSPAVLSPGIQQAVNLAISALRGFGRLPNDRYFALIHGSVSDVDRYKTTLIISEDGAASWELQEMPFIKEPLDFGLEGYAVMDGTLLMGSANGSILAYQPDRTTSVPGAQPDDPQIRVFPNPFDAAITVSGLEENSQYQLYGMDGRLIRRGTLTKYQQSITGLEELPPGIYVIHFAIGLGANSVKILKH